MREPVDGAELHDAPLPRQGAHLGQEPGEYYQWGDPSPSPVPKLNLQLLTLHDFKLFQLVSTYEIMQDIEDMVVRRNPWRAVDGSVIYQDWARMTLPLQSFTIVEVAKPNIGEKQPSRVRDNVTVHLGPRRISDRSGKFSVDIASSHECHGSGHPS